MKPDNIDDIRNQLHDTIRERLFGSGQEVSHAQ
jgi:hypothetical protein